MSLTQLVPTFIIHIDGSRIPVEQEAVIKEVVVTERVNASSSFSIKMSDPEGKWADHTAFKEGAEVKITMGFKDAVEEVFKGEVAGLAPSFEMANKGTFELKGFDKMHRLQRGKKTVSFAQKKDSDVISDIGSAVGLSVDADSVGTQQEFILQKDLSDFDYLRQLGRKHNCAMWCRDGSLMFKKVEGNASEDAVLEWGKTLISFQPRLSGMGLPTEMEVRGWDAAKFEPVVGTAKAGDIQVKIGGSKLGLKEVEKSFGASKATFVDESIIDVKGAEDAAVNMLTDISLGYITGSGKCEGNAKIRAASLIKIEGVGDRFSGKYFVESVKHHLIAGAGYKTTFSIKRNALP